MRRCDIAKIFGHHGVREVEIVPPVGDSRYVRFACLTS